MADAGEGDMRAGHQISAFHRLPECQIARDHGGLLVDVEFDGHIRLIELEDISMGDIAPEDDFLAIAFENDSAVAGRVASVKDRAETGNRRGIVAECLEFTGVDIGPDAFLGFGITLLQRFRGCLGFASSSQNSASRALTLSVALAKTHLPSADSPPEWSVWIWVRTMSSISSVL